MGKFLICFLLIFFLAYIYAASEWPRFFAYPCQEGLCVPTGRYNCPCWHFQHSCKPQKTSCCEDPNFFPMPGNMKSFTCKNQTKKG